MQLTEMVERINQQLASQNETYRMRIKTMICTQLQGLLRRDAALERSVQCWQA